MLLSALKTNPVADSIYNARYSPVRKVGEFPANISSQLAALEIPEVSLHSGNCSKPCQKIFVFKTSWNSAVPVLVDNNPCDSLRTRKGFYTKDENNNEIWEPGDAWQICKQVKAIIVDQ